MNTFDVELLESKANAHNVDFKLILFGDRQPKNPPIFRPDVSAKGSWSCRQLQPFVKL